MALVDLTRDLGRTSARRLSTVWITSMVMRRVRRLMVGPSTAPKAQGLEQLLGRLEGLSLEMGIRSTTIARTVLAPAALTLVVVDLVGSARALALPLVLKQAPSPLDLPDLPLDLSPATLAVDLAPAPTMALLLGPLGLQMVRSLGLSLVPSASLLLGL